MTTRNDTEIICALVSAVVHLREYIDTTEPFLADPDAVDLVAANTALQSYPLKQWIRHNYALIPVRRDGKEFYE